LNNANLEGADLRWADLRGATLSMTNLRQANLKGVGLRGASLQQKPAGIAWLDDELPPELTNALLSPETVLPDSSHWTPGRDLREFTHPEEWQAEQAAKQSSNPGSP